jgi:hypothetical protein
MAGFLEKRLDCIERYYRRIACRALGRLLVAAGLLGKLLVDSHGFRFGSKAV